MHGSITGNILGTTSVTVRPVHSASTQSPRRIRIGHPAAPRRLPDPTAAPLMKCFVRGQPPGLHRQRLTGPRLRVFHAHVDGHGSLGIRDAPEHSRPAGRRDAALPVSIYANRHGSCGCPTSGVFTGLAAPTSSTTLVPPAPTSHTSPEGSIATLAGSVCRAPPPV